MKSASKFLLVMTILSAFLWLFGLVAGATIPLFGGVKAEQAGGTCFIVSMVAELFMYLFGWNYQKSEEGRQREFTGFSGSKRYGNKPSKTE